MKKMFCLLLVLTMLVPYAAFADETPRVVIVEASPFFYVLPNGFVPFSDGNEDITGMVNYDTKEYTSQIIGVNKAYKSLVKSIDPESSGFDYMMETIVEIVGESLGMEWKHQKHTASGGCYKALGFCTVNGIQHLAILGIANEYATLIVISAEGEDNGLELAEIILKTLSFDYCIE